MAEPKNIIKTVEKVVPMIYAYTTPGVTYHEGMTKIGYTEKKTTEMRQREQASTIAIKVVEEWKGSAIYDDGTGDAFHDTDFHEYLEKNNIKRAYPRKDWFYIDPIKSRNMFYDFRANRGMNFDDLIVSPYTLRNEQEDAVSKTVSYIKNNPGKDFLWNAKPRFGKTLCVYDLIKKIKAERVLIVTNRPAVASSWYSDYVKFMGYQSDYYFVSDNVAIRNEKYAVGPESQLLIGRNYIEFESLQDIKGSVYLGGKFDKFKKLTETEWDLLVIDEAHEGVDTFKTDLAFEHINRKFTLHLSGTPFKALANDKFSQDAIYNWTYADEAQAREDWNPENGHNPYEVLPKMNMFTYKMSDIIMDHVSHGIIVEGEEEEYAFDLNEFFATNDSGHFIHEESVDKFLNALTTQKKFPFSSDELRNELKHTLWLLDRVDSAKELAKKLKAHPTFSEYCIIVAAGDGVSDDDQLSDSAFKKVTRAIEKYDKTITLSVGQLTTGVTIPEWTGVMILSNIRSSALYMQAAFRAQNPCLFRDGTEYLRKENCYVFDFDPARTLIVFETFANDLYPDTSAGRGDSEVRKKRIRQLLNFFPVIAEDENGEMVELDAAQVLTIPRKIKSQEVVRRGFMSNFLFQNISGVFGAPNAVIDILNKLKPCKESKKVKKLPEYPGADIPLGPDGEIEISDEVVIGLANDVFGNKLFSDEVIEDFEEKIKENVNDEAIEDRKKEAIGKQFQTVVVDNAMKTAKEKFGNNIRRSDERAISNQLNSKADRIIDTAFAEYNRKKEVAEVDKKRKLETSTSNESDEIIFETYQNALENAKEELAKSVNEELGSLIDDVPEIIVKHVETKRVQREEHEVKDDIRDHLRGFSRTIPSFIMAYGDRNLRLENFDKYTEEDVFLDVTSITLDDFKFLRDGGDYIDEETGEKRHFNGHLFDEIVFDDSVQEFLNLKEKLANYFDEKQSEDIFDYIPPQKTNQIFTPKKVVNMMVDQLEQENPGCFDDPTKTFADLYMKSGLYITEIVKRLYRSENMKKLFPDEKERLKHIFTKQVYGMAPTRIIYLIATNYIFGFDENMKRLTKNFVEADSSVAAQEGTLQQLVDESFDNCM